MSGIHVLRMGCFAGGFQEQEEPMEITDLETGFQGELIKAQISINNNGSVVGLAVNQNIVQNDEWWKPVMNDIGDNIWVRGTKIGGNLTSSQGLALNTVYRLDANRTWYIGFVNEVGLKTLDIRFDFYTNSGGTGSPIGSFVAELTCWWEI